MTIDDILKLPNGARFYRADMHIHSYGASHDVKDATMTPETIVNTAVLEKLDLIAVTDHNEIFNVDATIKAATGLDLFVIPGIELSTAQGHLLCYLPTSELLHKFFNRLNIVDKGLPNSRCQNAILECLNILKDLNGFAILAHVEVQGGFEFENKGSSPHKLDILCHEALLGIEVKRAESEVFYSPFDLNSDRMNIGNLRIKKLGLGANQYLARVLNSDAHTTTALGRNANGKKKVTRIKMDSPSFNAVRLAMDDADARIRIEDQIPHTVPLIAGLSLDGGFLTGQKIHFSPNLNCIIGGRGTGKSTTFEAVKCLVGMRSDNHVIDSDVWPGNIHLAWRDQAEQTHLLSRPLAGNVVNVFEPNDGPTSFHIESYSQGETERISKDAQNDPIALLSYLDKFVDLTDLKATELSIRNDLLMVQGEIEKSQHQVDKIPHFEQSLKITQQQLEALEKVKAKELIELTRRLAQERGIRDQVFLKCGLLKSEIHRKFFQDMLEQLSEAEKNQLNRLLQEKI
ncbi:MAG: PHP domain-containing protein [Pedobacter sp.]|nr:MAG: PHP domain-containing protein [Pedobacter sp.]